MTDRPWPYNDLSVSLNAGEPVSFVVIGDCICCSVCSDIAPDNFRLSDDEDHNICHQQPRDTTKRAPKKQVLKKKKQTKPKNAKLKVQGRVGFRREQCSLCFC